MCYYDKTEDSEGAVKRLCTSEHHEGKDRFLVYVPSMHSLSLAHAGQYAMTIYIVTPDALAKGTWSNRKESMPIKKK